MRREVMPINPVNILPNGKEREVLHKVELTMGWPTVSSHPPRAWLFSLLTITTRRAREAGGPV